MAPRVKTSERIVQTSLELFNQQGERSVSTNHIAAHMEISPGNLYYHFPNKQAIIAVLFREYEALVDSFLRPPQGRGMLVEDKRFYLQAVLAGMWRYRFLHRDLEHLLESDPELATGYRRFSQRCLIQGGRDLPGLCRCRHSQYGPGANRSPDPECVDHPHLVGALFVYHQ